MRKTLIVIGCLMAAFTAAMFFAAIFTHDSAPGNATPVKQQQPANALRRITAKSIENDLLRAGFDVQVSFIEEDDSKLLIYGKSVNRPFAHNLMAERSFQKVLKSAKFTKVTFLDSMTFPDFVQDYPVE